MAEINLPNCNHFRLLSVSYFLLSISRHLNIYHRRTCINKFASFYHYRCYPPRCRTHRRRVPSVTFHDRCQHPMCQQGFNNYARQSQKVNKHYIHAQGTVTIMSPMSAGSKEARGQLDIWSNAKKLWGNFSPNICQTFHSNSFSPLSW